jgi:hypothetical protein
MRLKGRIMRLYTARELRERIDTNDNRCTAKPYALLLREKRVYIADKEYCDNMRWVEHYTGDCATFDSKEDAISYFRDDISDWCDEFEGMEGEELDDAIVDKFKIESFAEGEYSETVNVFLTDKGYQDHMNENGHNISSLSGHDTYGIHLFRNKEMSSLYSLIDENIEQQANIDKLKYELKQANASIVAHGKTLRKAQDQLDSKDRKIKKLTKALEFYADERS